MHTQLSIESYRLPIFYLQKSSIPVSAVGCTRGKRSGNTYPRTVVKADVDELEDGGHHPSSQLDSPSVKHGRIPLLTGFHQYQGPSSFLTTKIESPLPDSTSPFDSEHFHVPGHYLFLHYTRERKSLIGTPGR